MNFFLTLITGGLRFRLKNKGEVTNFGSQANTVPEPYSNDQFENENILQTSISAIPDWD